MVRLVFVLFVTLFFSNCKMLYTSSGKSSTAEKRILRFNDSLSKTGIDTLVPKPISYLPLYGRRESGVDREIEGTWELDSMEGYTVKGDVNNKLDSLEKLKLSRVTKDGVSFSFSTDPKITPPQGSRYHIPDKPTISFYGSNETFSGFTGCNRFSGRYEMPDSSTILLKTAAPSTRMVCIGDYDEDVFIAHLHRVDKFRGQDDRLELLEGDKVIMTFVRKEY